MDHMIHHCKAVRRGAPNTFMVGDMPSMSYHESNEQAIRNAGRFIKEGRCDAVKLEWCNSVVERVRAITDAGILVMGHVGFTPQRTAQLGGYRIQGRGDEKNVVVDQARQLQEAGAFCVLMEMVPPEVGRAVTETLDVFTIGVGAGPDTDMQMVVINDLLGIFEKFKPKYVKRYLNIAEMATDALKQYIAETREGSFPTDENFYS
ncbi:MAG: 3-methyl-2-oxobutanoate hydroxymethyltransferase [Planctomycetota bacterium]|nr:3-methyl-2-oxobutanoate hydroxymethyltransferase [Planctomycetota bacterium]